MTPTDAAAERFFRSGDGLQLFYRDFAPLAPTTKMPVLCLPGLTRNSRDFTHVAERIRRDRRVLCADLRGRGRSQHDPVWQNYHPGTYLADIGLLLSDAGVARCVLLGTSLGGILSMLLVATNPSLVAGVILNDVGPEVAPEGLARISAYVGRHAPPANWDEAVATVQATYEVGMPGLTHEEWVTHTKRSYSDVDGVPRLDMDPMIGEAVRSAPAAAAPDLWPRVCGARGRCRRSRSAVPCPTFSPGRRSTACCARSPTCCASKCRSGDTRRCSTSPSPSRPSTTSSRACPDTGLAPPLESRSA